MRTARLRVSLREVTPPVLRVIDLPASSTLPEVHEALQAAVGWTDSHLHRFVAGEACYGVPDDEDDWSGEQDEAAVRLKDLPTRFTYLYDFGDGWEHDVEVLGAGADQPGCPYGEGSCPPEDCGGPYGYAELLEVLADPMHPDYDDMRSWVGGRLAGFDQGATDLQVWRTVGEVPASVRLVLELAEAGVKLTPGGRLPRAFVRQVQQQRPHWSPLGRPATVEHNLPPLAVLHDLLRDVGLLRLRKGVLTPTRAAADDVEAVRRVRSWFAPETFTTIVAGLTVATLATSGPQQGDALVATLHALLGTGWARDGQPITERDLRIVISGLSPVLQALDQVERDWPAWRAGPCARSLIPRATALSALWS